MIKNKAYWDFRGGHVTKSNQDLTQENKGRTERKSITFFSVYEKSTLETALRFFVNRAKIGAN